MSSLIVVFVLLSFLLRVVEGMYEMVESFIQLYEAFYMYFFFFSKRQLRCTVSSKRAYEQLSMDLIQSIPVWIKHKLKSRLLAETSVTSDMQMTPP